MSKITKKGLGKGLSALFGDSNVKPEPKKQKQKQEEVNVQKMALIGDLNRNPYQPRTRFDEDKINELSKSIKQNGLIQPIAVRNDKTDPGRYEIVAGERRWLAAQKAGLNEVPVIVLNIDDQKSLEIAIVENVQRQDLNIIEEAKGYKRLIPEFIVTTSHIAMITS